MADLDKIESDIISIPLVKLVKDILDDHNASGIFPLTKDPDDNSRYKMYCPFHLSDGLQASSGKTFYIMPHENIAMCNYCGFLGGPYAFLSELLGWDTAIPYILRITKHDDISYSDTASLFNRVLQTEMLMVENSMKQNKLQPHVIVKSFNLPKKFIF